MEENYRSFGQDFSAAIIAKDYAAAHRMMAPWLKNEPKSLHDGVSQQVKDMLEAWGMEQEVFPAECDLDGNAAMTADSLREDEFVPNFPDEITDENFRYWMAMQFMPAEGEAEFDAFFDLWIAIVEHDGKLKVGYYNFTEPD